jgi:peptide/nickel transport system substrate-binding protein
VQARAAAGYPVPPGGGPRLHLVYKTSSDAFRVALAHVIASQLGEVGIDVEVRPFEFGTFFADVKKGAFQLASMQSTDIGEPDLLRTYFNESQIPTAAAPTLQNRWHYRNAVVDQLTENGRRIVDPAQRKVIYSWVQKILAVDVPVIPLWHEDNVVLMNKDLSGYRVLPNARFNGLITVVKQ